MNHKLKEMLNQQMRLSHHYQPSINTCPKYPILNMLPWNNNWVTYFEVIDREMQYKQNKTFGLQRTDCIPTQEQMSKVIGIQIVWTSFAVHHWQFPWFIREAVQTSNSPVVGEIGMFIQWLSAVNQLDDKSMARTGGVRYGDVDRPVDLYSEWGNLSAPTSSG